MSLSSSQRFLLGGAFLAAFLFGFVAGAWGILLPDVMGFYRLTPVTVGLFFVTIAVGYVLGALGCGQWFSAQGARTLLLLGSFLLLLSSLLLGFRPPLLLAVGAYGLIGFSVGLLDTSYSTLLACFPRSATWLHLYMASFSIGGLVSPLMTGALLAARWGWNSVFFVLGSLCVPLLLLCALQDCSLFTAMSTSSRHADGSHAQIRDRGTVLAALASPQVWLLGLFILFAAGVYGSLNSWFYSFALYDRHLTPSLASTLMSGFWLGLLFARLFLHLIVDRWRMSKMSLIFGCLGGTILGVALLWVVPGGAGMAICCVLVGLCQGSPYPTVLSLVPDLIEPSIVSRALSLMMATNIVGSMLLPLSVGALVQQVGFWTLPFSLLGATAVALGIWWVLYGHGQRVMRRREAID
ncbi:MAG: MFS transporter [Ktedonobacteraceae bacterium]|nr:MFS transporter [Ktedonobacteraceae bacterium]MBO0793776.1 MFS transporter [Ktedonobacteraceae bacterium]